MAVDLVVGSGNLGGTERQVAGLALGLREQGEEVSVTFLEGVGPLVEHLVECGIPVRTVGYGGISPSRIPFIPTRDSFSGVGRLIGSRRRSAHHPQISHAFLDGSIAVAPLLDLANQGTPHRIAGIRGARDLNGYAHRLFRRNLRRVDAVVCNAPHLVEEMVETYGIERSRVRWIANGVVIPERVAEVDVEPAVAVVVANLRPYKGYDVLLDALPRVERPINVRCCGAGRGRDTFQAQVADLGLSRRLILVEPPADVASEVLSAQFAIHPSRTEGLSNAILEELAAGLPVIACAVGGNTTLIEHGVNGLLVPPGDAHALATAIDSLAGDPALRRRMSTAARQTAERYSWPACVAAHQALYRKLLDQPRLRR
jgi:glycosyltransferase involved in cell wall biosynthesis